MLFSKQSDGKPNWNDKDNHDGDDGDNDNKIVDGNDDEDNHNNYLVVATNLCDDDKCDGEDNCNNKNTDGDDECSYNERQQGRRLRGVA